MMSSSVEFFKSDGDNTQTPNLLKGAYCENQSRQFCCNTNCNAKTLELFDAPRISRIYYGLPIERLQGASRRKICRNCLQKASAYHEASKQIIRKKENLFALKFETQSSDPDVIMIDIDHEDETEEIISKGDSSLSSLSSKHQAVKHDLMTYSVSRKTLDVVIKQFDLANQGKKCQQKVEEEVIALGIEMNLLDQQMDSAMTAMYGALQLYNDNIAENHQVVELGSVDVNEDGTYSIKQSEQLTDQLTKLEVTKLPKVVADFQDTMNSIDRMGSNKNTDASIFKKALHPLLQNQAVAKTPPLFLFKPPGENQMVYVMSKDLLKFWVPGRITKISKASAEKMTEYTVRVYPNGNGYKTSTSADVAAGSFTKTYPGKYIAFMKPILTIILPVGCRIIGQYKDILGNNPELNDKFYVGVVAESPTITNKNRYLVFFDDGYPQYLEHNCVMPVVESSPNVWEDVFDEMQAFIKEYIIQSYSEKILRKPKINDVCKIKLNAGAKWIPACIVQVDCSLLKVRYTIKVNNIDYFEWIYCRSPRLRFDDQNRMAPLNDRKSISSSIQLEPLDQPANRIKSRNGVYELLANDRFEINPSLEKFEYDGTMTKIFIPQDCPLPKPYMAHDCSSSCVYMFKEDKYRDMNPLVVPFHLGWAREIGGINRNEISYVSPCGIRFTSYKAIHAYNRNTNANIPVEFFALNVSVDCLNGFKSSRQIRFLKDISYGKEWTSVQCLNSIDHSLPEHVDYVCNRVPGEGVLIKEDDKFLTCCDCDDDCEDKLKCPCWQMTLSGNSFRNKGIKGYEYRRLGNPIDSGIYECNRRCKCNVNTCLNRVVQSKVKWPVQVFKTVKKGWGVRALHDMPKGSFLCVYAGQLLNDAGADKVGLKDGDEYLADLDFIESQEAIKEGYEAMCVENVKTDIKNINRNSEENNQAIPNYAKKSTSGSRAIKKKPFAKNSTSGERFRRCTTPTLTATCKRIPAMPYRRYFGKSEKSYSIDGKKMGNFGRYFNHSCDPNLFIQNVFVDTHDLRFPWVAFFTKKDIKAGAELCWDYKYEAGSVVGKSLYCYCDSHSCRKRLL